jgi:MoaA/NifB/PqqE/SkfB family radical SAM enzyme
MDFMALKAQNQALNSKEIRSGNVYLKSTPVSLSFAICGPFNLECVHCGFHLFGRTSDKQVSEEVYSKVLSEIMPTAYTCHLGGSNWGEMTIAKNFHRFLLDAKKFGVRINLTTNGTRLIDDWFNDLLDTLSVIGLSMEGINEEFEKVRGFRWRHFLKNVEKVCQGRADRGKNFRVEWRYCAHAGSIHQLPDMIRLARSVGVDRIQVMNLVTYVKSQKYNSLFYHRSLANHYFAESRKIAEDLNFDVEIPPDFNTGEFPKSRLSQTTRDSQLPPESATTSNTVTLVNCYRPWQICVVTEIGEVTPSDIYWRSMGNLQSSTFASIWNGWKYRRLRAAINTRPDSICHACRLPQFDSEENRASMQLVPSLKQSLVISAKSLLAGRAKTNFSGVMDKEIDPASKSQA